MERQEELINNRKEIISKIVEYNKNNPDKRIRLCLFTFSHSQNGINKEKGTILKNKLFSLLNILERSPGGLKKQIDLVCKIYSRHLNIERIDKRQYNQIKISLEEINELEHLFTFLEFRRRSKPKYKRRLRSKKSLKGRRYKVSNFKSSSR